MTNTKNFDITLTPQEHRERIVLQAKSLGNLSIEDCEQIDVLVCEALEIDHEQIPPDFILFD